MLPGQGNAQGFSARRVDVREVTLRIVESARRWTLESWGAELALPAQDSPRGGPTGHGR